MKNKDFYSKLSEANNLTREFESKITFYKERIQQNKLDSLPFFNEDDVVQAVKEFKKETLENPHNFNLEAEPFVVSKRASHSVDGQVTSDPTIPSNEEFKLDTSSGGQPQGSLSNSSRHSVKESTSESSNKKIKDPKYKEFGTNTDETLTYYQMVDKSLTQKLLTQV